MADVISRRAGLVAAVVVLAAGAVAAWWMARPEPEVCLARDLGERLHRDRLLLGGAMPGQIFREAPFDLRYHYVAGGVPDAPCTDCRECTVGGTTCANPSECGWWGCWQRDDVPPGAFVDRFVADAETHGAIPMLTWYQWFYVAGRVEAEEEIARLADGEAVRRYVDDFRRLAARVGAAATGPVIVHLEPDLWAFARKVASDPRQVPVALSTSGDTLCRSLPEDLSGLARCLAGIARAEIPEVVVALHASSWDDQADALINADPTFDVEAHARATADYLVGLGAEPDLLVVETNHRDAGYNGVWWDPEDRTLPDFAQALTWARALSQRAGLPHLWWQVPYGNPGLDDTCGRYRDNRLDTFFDDPGRFADGTALGVAFGAGADCMTTPLSDGGRFVERARAWYVGERVPLCP